MSDVLIDALVICVREYNLMHVILYSLPMRHILICYISSSFVFAFSQVEKVHSKHNDMGSGTCIRTVLCTILE